MSTPKKKVEPKFTNLVLNPCGQDGFDHWQFCEGQSIQQLSETRQFKETIETYRAKRVLAGQKHDWDIEWYVSSNNWATEAQQGVFERMCDENDELVVNFATSCELGKKFDLTSKK